MHFITVREKTDDGLMQFDLYSRLNEDRIIFLDREFTDETASATVMQLQTLSSKSQEEDITMWINSPGGSCTAGLAIYDTMQMIPNDIKTIVIGEACSMGAFMLSAGTKGKRFATQNSWVMIHMVSSGARGTVADMEITMKQSLDIDRKLAEQMAVHCGRSYEEIKEATTRDKWLTPQDAVEFGLVDEIIQPLAGKWGLYKNAPDKKTVAKKKATPKKG
jgi:ATP-dependent Clp protease protease subunit